MMFMEDNYRLYGDIDLFEEDLDHPGVFIIPSQDLVEVLINILICKFCCCETWVFVSEYDEVYNEELGARIYVRKGEQ